MRSSRKRTVLFGGRCACDSGGTGEVWEYGAICRPDCDGFSSPASLTILDFACFLNQFAAGQEWPTPQIYSNDANCDGSTTDPVLTIADFLCFLNQFAAGCP